MQYDNVIFAVLVCVLLSAGSDFESLEETVIFPPGSVNGSNGMSACVTVTIVNNTAFEKSEYFALVIVAVEDNVVILFNLTIHIIDDDCK